MCILTHNILQNKCTFAASEIEGFAYILAAHFRIYLRNSATPGVVYIATDGLPPQQKISRLADNDAHDSRGPE